MINNSDVMTEVYFFSKAQKLSHALDLLGITDFKGVKVPVKLHMGEPCNRYYISPSTVKLVIDKLKDVGAQPFLFDTTVVYSSPRSTKEGYAEVADQHGFGENNMGCKVVIGDEGIETAEGGCNFEVAKELYESTHMVVISHVKGHMYAGFGGAIKNLGMGGVTKNTKRMIHVMSRPMFLLEKCELCGSCADVCLCHAISVDSEWQFNKGACDGCGKCVAACPTGALSYKVMDLHKGLALSAKACITGKRVLYVNALVNIARDCDCDPCPDPIVCPDIGYLASSGIAAIDRASLELIDKIKPRVFEEAHGVDPYIQVRYVQELGFSSSYELIKL